MFERLLDAAGNAATTVRNLLMEPVDLRKWAVLAFLVFLANCGSVSSSLQVNVDSNQGNPFNGVQDLLGSALNTLGAVGFLAIVLLLTTAFTLIVLFISTRAEFMLLDSLQQRQPRFSAWEERSNSANQVYAMRTLLMAGLVGLSFTIMAGALVSTAALPGALPPMVLGMALLFMAIGSLVVFTEWLFVDLVPAIMVVTGETSVTAALRRLRTIPIGELAAYVVLQFGIAISIRFVAVPVFCLCCCVAPIPGSLYVLLLPLTLWRRAFTLEWLQAHSPAS